MKIVRQIGKPVTFRLPSGEWITAQDKIYIPEWDYFVPVAWYDNHTIYEVPKNQPGPAYMCTCGCPAIVVGYDAYKGDASMQGAMFVCSQHVNTGLHADGSK